MNKFRKLVAINNNRCIINCVSVTIVLIIGLIFNIFQAHTLNIWYDEAITLLQLSGNAEPDWPSGMHPASQFKALFLDRIPWHEIVPMLQKTDVHPPLYYSVAWLFYKISPDLFSVRILSAISIFLSAIAFLSSGPLTRNYSFIIVIIITLFYFAPQIQWAALNARGYGLALLFTTTAFAFTVKFFNASDNSHNSTINPLYCLYAAVIFAGLALWTHYFTIMITSPMLAILFIFAYRKYSRHTTISSIIFIMTVFTIIPVIAEQFNSRPHQYDGFSTFAREASFLTRNALHLFSEHIENVWIGRFQLLFMAGLYCFGAFAIWKRRQLPFSLIIIVPPITFGVLLIMLFYMTDKTLFHGGTERYILFVTPAVLYLVAEAVLSITYKSRALGSIVVLALFAQIGYTWHDLSIEWRPWSNHYISDLNSQLEQSEEVLVIVPEGYGRGIPGVWAYESAESHQMIVSKDGSDINLSDITRFEYVVLVESETDEFRLGHERISEALESGQYHLQKYRGATLYKHRR